MRSIPRWTAMIDALVNDRLVRPIVSHIPEAIERHPGALEHCKWGQFHLAGTFGKYLQVALGVCTRCTSYCNRKVDGMLTETVTYCYSDFQRKPRNIASNN